MRVALSLLCAVLAPALARAQEAEVPSGRPDGGAPADAAPAAPQAPEDAPDAAPGEGQGDADAAVAPEISEPGDAAPGPGSPPPDSLPEGEASPAAAPEHAPPPMAQPQQDQGAAPALPETEAPIEVIAVGTRVTRMAGAAHVIRERELERFEYDDPTAVLTSVPGVYARTEDGMGLRPNIGVRGVNPDRSKKVTLLEDGILFGPAPYSAPAAYYFPIITRMSQVRVLKGPSAVSQGPHTVAGAVDLITRTIPAAPRGEIDLAAGQYGYGKGHAYFGASTEQFGFLVEGVHLQNAGFKRLPDERDTGFARNEWMGKFSYVVDPTAEVRNEFRLKLTYSDEVSNETYLGLSDADFHDDPYRRYGASALDQMRNHRFSGVLTHEAELGTNATWTTSIYRHAFSRVWRRADRFLSRDLFSVLQDPEGAAAYINVLRGSENISALGDREALLLATNGREFLSQGVQSTFAWDGEGAGLAHRVEAGLRLHYDRIDRRHTADEFDLFEGELYPNASPTLTTTFNKGSTYAAAPHLLYAVTYRDLTLTPGMRAELMRMTFVDRATGETLESFTFALLPGLGLYYAITEELGLLAGAYRGFSPSPPEDAKRADPEYSINYEAGARYSDGPLRAEVIGFFNDYSNLTDYCTISGGCGDNDSLGRQISGGRAHIYGLEVFAGQELRAGRIRYPLSLAYTYTHAEFRETPESFGGAWGGLRAGDVVPYVPPHQLRASAGVESRPAGGALGFTYVAATSEGRVSSDGALRPIETDPQYLLDASAWARVWRSISIYATAQNLLDSAFIVARRPFGARPNAPRWVHVGLKAAL